MKKQITEVHDYFADKLSRGLYKVKEISDYTVNVIVDNEYNFSLWIANGVIPFRTYSGHTNFMNITFTNSQKKRGYKIAEKYYKEWVYSVKKEEDLAELKRLREKYDV